jgi:acetolactate synthase-1/2/3 large subunit
VPFGSAFADALAADVVLCLGVRLGWALLNGAYFAGATVIRVDCDAAETARNRAGDLNLVADVRVLCEQLAGAWDGGVSPERAAWGDRLRAAAVRGRDELMAPVVAHDAKYPHPLGLVATAAEVAGPEATLVADGGDIVTWAMAGLPAHGPGRLLTTGVYLGCLGVGIPFALAAKLARPEHPVVLIEGDGSFGLNAMEFDTAVRHDIPFVCVVSNDGSWGMSRHGQDQAHGEGHHAATDLGVRPYHEVVRALGGYGEFVDDAGELRGAIDRALSSGLPACVNVAIDPALFSPLTAMMGELGVG